MTRSEIENTLDTLYDDLSFANTASEHNVCIAFNTDSREEAIQATNEEIEYYERKLRDIEAYEHRKLNYERTADAPYICW